MVVCGVFILLSTVVLANNTRFGNIIVLQNLAHNIALSIREAQVFGLASLQYGAQNFDTGYGVHITQGAGYELFADVNGNGIYDSTEEVKPYTLGGGYTITDICAPSITCGRSRLDILFKRPEADACISAGESTPLDGDGDCISSVQRAVVTLSSARGDTATIIVESTGQISVQ